jgi:5-formyltetrahydrofolate cyclo-ligase
VRSPWLHFHDGFIDHRIREAVTDTDIVINSLAKAIVSRQAPKMIAEVSGLEETNIRHNQAAMFRQECKLYLPELARKYSIRMGQFLVCGPKPIKFEERSSHFNIREARDLKPEEREELIMVFCNGEAEPHPPLLQLPLCRIVSIVS